MSDQTQALAAARASARIVEAADGARREIGRHLHDRVQTLAIAARQRLFLAREDPARLAEVDALLEQLTEELRDLARGLHPAGLEGGLRPALETLARRSPLPLRIVELPDAPLGGAVETTLFALVSESLNNAAKHAGATRVELRAHAGATTLVVTVHDDGAGGADASAGSGLLGIGDRVMLLGGELGVESPPGGGTTVRATIPLAPVRLPHRQFFQMGAQSEPSIQRILRGEKTCGISLAREWATEGGPPRLGQIVPVMDGAGRHRLDVEVTGLELVAFEDIDAATYAAAGVDGATAAECQAAVRAFYTDARAALAFLFEEPDWTLAPTEPMVVLRHRIAATAG